MANSSLVIDCTNSYLVVGFFADGQSISRCIYSPRESFNRLIPTVSDVLAEAGAGAPDQIITAIGPGSFTGIRICVSAARDLAQLWEKPAFGINSLTFYAACIPDSSGPLCVLVDGKQNRFYSKFFASTTIDMLDASPTEDLTAEQIIARLDGTESIYCDQPETFLERIQEAARKNTELLKNKTSLSPNVKKLPQPNAETLYRVFLTLSPKSLSFQELKPLYMRKNPAEAKYPQGFKKSAGDQQEIKNKT